MLSVFFKAGETSSSPGVLEEMWKYGIPSLPSASAVNRRLHENEQRQLAAAAPSAEPDGRSGRRGRDRGGYGEPSGRPC